MFIMTKQRNKYETLHVSIDYECNTIQFVLAEDETKPPHLQKLITLPLSNIQWINQN